MINFVSLFMSLLFANAAETRHIMQRFRDCIQRVSILIQ